MKNYLKKCLSVQSESYNQFRTFAFVIRELKAMQIDFYVSDGCIYATKGAAENYPCIVSHLDTVHNIVKGFEVLESKGYFFAVDGQLIQTGIGGDDKVGIFICLQLLKTEPVLKAVFFRDEEVGCCGSYDADKDFFLNCAYILQCDRKGYGDFVTEIMGSKLSSKQFKKDIKDVCKDFEFSFCSGGMTDVLALHEIGVGVSVANISCGYYRPHTSEELVNISEVFRTLLFVQNIIKQLGQVRYEHKGGNGYKQKYVFEDSSFSSWAGYEDKQKKVSCDLCGFHTADFTKVQNMFICDNCYDELSKEGIVR